MTADKTENPTRYQSVCRWSFHPGKGGFVPGDIRPEFKDITSSGFVELVAEKIRPRVPENTRLGVAVHYDREIDEKTAESFAKALRDNGLVLSMITPGAHYYFAYGGIGSPDPDERKKAGEFGKRTVDLMMGPLKDVQDPACPAAFDIWNGSFGYEIPTVLLTDMLKYADEAIGELLDYARSKDPNVKMGVEPKPNEGHAAMLYQTSGEVLALRGRLKSAGHDVSNFGLINEFGHTEMAGLDLVQEYAAASLEDAIVHVHANSQGGDGVRLGGGGKFDIDFGVAPGATTLAIAQILNETGYAGWIEHDMQPRPYDSAAQNIDRVVRSICNWEAIARVVESGGLSRVKLESLASSRNMVEFEDLVRDAVADAHILSKELYSIGN
ncbi:MAG: xylose isomerase [Planctomycetota bacterium]|nr:MAG: xylose isomerase [Planctomycetota bacterium]